MDKVAMYKAEIEKIAQTLSKKQQNDIDDIKKEYRGKALKTWGAGLGVTTAGQLVAMDMLNLHKHKNPNKKYTTPEQNERMVHKYLKQQGLDKKISVENTGFAGARAMGPHFRPTENVIDAGGPIGGSAKKNSARFFTAHEVGHAEGAIKHPGLTKGALGLRVGGPAAVGIAGLALSSKKLRDKVRSLDHGNKDGKANKTMNFIERHPFLAYGGATAAAMLPMEIAANKRAVSLLAKRYGAKRALKLSAKPIAENMTSYTGTALAGGMLPALLTNHSVKKGKIKAIKKEED